VQQGELLLALDKKLPAILQGDAQPANFQERFALAWLCDTCKRRYAAAARYYAESFADDPRVVNFGTSYRYRAACAAVLAAAGQGEDAKALPDKTVVGLRHQALRWLRADLILSATAVQREDASTKQFVRQQLTHWQQNSDLASVRDKAALERLPEIERREWRRLWDDVTALLARAGPTP